MNMLGYWIRQKAHAMEESEMDYNGKAPHDVLHRLVQEDGMQE